MKILKTIARLALILAISSAIVWGLSYPASQLKMPARPGMNGGSSAQVTGQAPSPAPDALSGAAHAEAGGAAPVDTQTPPPSEARGTASSGSNPLADAGGSARGRAPSLGAGLINLLESLAKVAVITGIILALRAIATRIKRGKKTGVAAPKVG